MCNDVCNETSRINHFGSPGQPPAVDVVDDRAQPGRLGLRQGVEVFELQQAHAVEPALSLIPQAFAAYEKLRRPRVEKVIAATNRKNSAKAAGPVMRTINAWAIKIFAKLAKPEKMAWVFHYRINWDARM